MQVPKKWSILKWFYNGKKVLLILLLLNSNKLESDFKIKAYCCNNFFASRCIPLANSSTVPNSLQYISTTRLYSFCFNEEVILKIIITVKIYKVHEHDDEFGYSSYAVSLLLNSCLWFSRTTLILSHTELSERNQI